MLSPPRAGRARGSVPEVSVKRSVRILVRGLRRTALERLGYLRLQGLVPLAQVLVLSLEGLDPDLHGLLLLLQLGHERLPVLDLDQERAHVLEHRRVFRGLLELLDCPVELLALRLELYLLRGDHLYLLGQLLELCDLVLNLRWDVVHHLFASSAVSSATSAHLIYEFRAALMDARSSASTLMVTSPSPATTSTVVLGTLSDISGDRAPRTAPAILVLMVRSALLVKVI